MIKVIAVNAGSSSIKYKLFEMPEEKVIASGIVERIGHEDAIFKFKGGKEEKKEILPILDHGAGVKLILEALESSGVVSTLKEIAVVGHRVVQGGKYFAKSAYFTKETEDRIEELVPLDPLHAPAHLLGFHAFKDALPEAKAIAVFDTAFHQSMEEEDYLFPIPDEWSEKYDCRRYGAHGTSHQYLSIKGIHDFLNNQKESKIITCHIGSGASLCAIKNGKCVATSMGLTPLGGVMMGTRSGDIDPSVLDYISTCTGKDVHELYEILNRKSGLYGVSGGLSNDTRDIEEAMLKGDKKATRAANLFARRIADYIGQYYVRLGGADLLVFSAGIGENSPIFRKMIIDRVKEALGIELDEEKNESLNRKEGVISTPNSKIMVAIIPTDEELMIARDSYKAWEGTL